MEFKDVFTFEHLYSSYLKCIKGVSWKGTVQNYKYKSLSNIFETLQDLNNEKFKSGKFYEFDLIERGKLRHIKSVGIRERVEQRCLCDYCLVPTLSSQFIYDNMACLKGKGLHVALNRMEQQLRLYYKKYGTNVGYILQYDFHHYFETIPHELLLEKVKDKIDDPKLFGLISQLVNDFDGDIGIGLGSQISQILALYYPNDIDHKLISYKKNGRYGRYMDDGYLISNNKQILQECKELLRKMANALGIVLNENKTQIKRIDRGFVYLKARFYLLPSGKVIKKPNKKNIAKNRRKLKKLFALGKPLEVIDHFVDDVLGTWKHYDAHNTTRSFIKLYKEELKMLKQDHPYVDEKGVSHPDLVHIYSDANYEILQEDTGMIYEDVVDPYPTCHSYVELTPEYYASLNKKVDA